LPFRSLYFLNIIKNIDVKVNKITSRKSGLSKPLTSGLLSHLKQ
jgi:hypothetical protein